MVHILLLILKIIGIIFLAILALCLLILFFPVTYKVKGKFEGKDFQISVKGGWLFHLLHFGGKFSNEKNTAKIRILGIPINLLKEKSESKKKSNQKKNKKKKHKNDKKKKDKSFVENKPEVKVEKFSDEKQTDNHILEQDEKQTDDIIFNQSEKQTGGKQNEEKKQYRQKDSLIVRIKAAFKTVCNFIRKIINTVRKAFKDVKGAYNKAKEMKAFVTANTTKEAYQYGKRIILKAIKHIFPTKIRTKIHFGFEQPDVTGKMLGYIAMVCSVFHTNTKRIDIIPDFDKKVFEGNIKIKGHFFIGILLIYVLKFYFKKEIHDIIKKFN